jgi:hypothetical protein
VTITEAKLSQATGSATPAIFHPAIVFAALRQGEPPSVGVDDAEYLAEKSAFLGPTGSSPMRSDSLSQQGTQAFIGEWVYRDIRDAAEMSLQSATFVWSEAV